ncbi:MAG: hypothetical protein IT453_12450 [Planctomycetes bacterium]|nr:hypothetical protein [Planctomycetota bacterium]
MPSLLMLLFVPALALVVVLGIRLARRRSERVGPPWKPSGLESNLIIFYGFLLSFVFFLSGNAHRENVGLVHDQAEALAMIHREAELLPPADGDAVRAAVRAILEIEVRETRSDDDARAKLDAECDAAYDALWETLSSRAAAPGALPTYRAALDRAQRSISLHYRLVFSETERTPGALIALVVAGALLIGFLIGFTCGSGGHGRLVPWIYVLLASCTIATILDLNDPRHGFLQPSRANFQQLLDALAN